MLIENLLAAGATVRAYDPEAMKEAHKSFGDRITYGKKAYDVLGGADALVIVTEWNEFRHPDLERVKTLLKTPVIVDGRNLFEPKRCFNKASTTKVSAAGCEDKILSKPAGGLDRAGTVANG